MQVDDCIRGIVEATPGASLRSVSRDLGHADTWARNVGAPGRSPALASVIEVADLCGYDLAVVRRSDGVTIGTIEPPKREGHRS